MTARNRPAWPLWLLAAGCALLAPRLFGSGFALALLTQIAIAAIACLSYNLLLGEAGLLSFGHAIYTGLGAYAAIHALNALALPVPLLPLLGGLAGLALALPLGWLSTRRAGTPFAMITLGLGELVAAAALMFPQLFGGESGIPADRTAAPALFGIRFGAQIEVYWLAAGWALACAAMLRALKGTPFGLALNAVRDNAERAQFLGHDPHRLRWLATLFAGFCAGVSGALAAVHFEIVSAEALGASRSAALLLFTFLGGSGHFIGPVLGAVLMVLSSSWLSTLTGAAPLYLGLLFLLMVVRAPGGIAGLIASRRAYRQGPGGIALAATVALALLGAGALVELLYRLQLGDALGGRIAYFGLALDTGRADDWVGALLALLTGCGLFALVHQQPTQPSDQER